MIEAVHADLSVTAQCRLLSISRSSFYYTPQPESDETLALMRVIDAAFLDMPWYLHAFETGSELRVGLTRWIGYYNADRPHLGLAGQTPDEAYGTNEMRSLAGLALPAKTLQLAA